MSRGCNATQTLSYVYVWESTINNKTILSNTLYINADINNLEHYMKSTSWIGEGSSRSWAHHDLFFQYLHRIVLQLGLGLGRGDGLRIYLTKAKFIQFSLLVSKIFYLEFIINVEFTVPEMFFPTIPATKTPYSHDWILKPYSNTMRLKYLYFLHTLMK